MSTKIKIFSGKVVDEIQEEVNSWINLHDNIKVTSQDMTYNSDLGTYALSLMYTDKPIIL